MVDVVLEACMLIVVGKKERFIIGHSCTMTRNIVQYNALLNYIINFGSKVNSGAHFVLK